MNARLGALLLTVVAAVGLTGCTSSGRQGNPFGAPNPAGVAGNPFGYVPVPSDSVTYQPDVVLVGHGVNAVRSVSMDGLTWTIDDRADGADKLAVGKIMFATSRAVGRVVGLNRSAEGLEVTLAPVTLTDIVRQAHLRNDAAISAADLSYQALPDPPGQPPVSTDIPDSSELPMPTAAQPAPAAPSPEPSAGPSPAPTSLRSAPLLSLQGNGRPTLPPPNKTSVKLSVGNWETEPYLTDERIGLKLAYKTNEDKGAAPGGGDASGSLKFGADFALSTKDLHITSSQDIVDGAMTGQTLLIQGLKGISIDLAAGVASRVDNPKVRAEVPVELMYHYPATPTFPIPLVAQFKFKFLVEVAFSAKMSTLSTGADYVLSGPLGITDGKMVVPTFAQTDRGLVGSIQGVSVGINAIVFGWEMRVLVGVGIPDAMAGVYTKMIIGASILRGSDTTAPWGVCAQATLKVDLAAGAGFQVSSKARQMLTKLLGDKVKLEAETEHRETIAGPLKGYMPANSMCRI